MGRSSKLKIQLLALEKCIGGVSEAALRKLLTPGVKKRKADRYPPEEQHGSCTSPDFT